MGEPASDLLLHRLIDWCNLKEFGGGGVMGAGGAVEWVESRHGCSRGRGWS